MAINFGKPADNSPEEIEEVDDLDIDEVEELEDLDNVDLDETSEADLELPEEDDLEGLGEAENLDDLEESEHLEDLDRLEVAEDLDDLDSLEGLRDLDDPADLGPSTDNLADHETTEESVLDMFTDSSEPKRSAEQEMLDSGVSLYSDIDNLLTGVKYTREYREISVEDLVISEMSKSVRSQTVKGLTATVKDFGQILSPIEVIEMPSPDEEKTYLLITGLRRFYGAVRNNMTTIPAFVWNFQDYEKGSKMAFLLGLVINKQQQPDMKEIWMAMGYLERDYNLKPSQIERLFNNLQGGDAMKLKDVAMGEYDEPRDLLFSGEKTLEQAYKLLQKMRKEEDSLEVEENVGIVSNTQLGTETVTDEESLGSDNLSREEVMSILEMDEDVDYNDDSIFNENADEGHVQDRKGDGDDDLSTDAKNKIKLRDSFICRACCRLEGEGKTKYVEIDPARVNDAPSFNSLLTVHHIIPVHAGGTDDDENLVTLCLGCHHRLHVMEKIGGIMVDKATFEKMSAQAQHEVKAAYYYARKAIKAGQLKGYNRKQRAEQAQVSLKHKYPGRDIKNDTALLKQLSKQ